MVSSCLPPWASSPTSLLWWIPWGRAHPWRRTPTTLASSPTRLHMAGVDLNAMADCYPPLQSYQQLPQGGGSPSGQGLHPLCIGPRSGAGQFVPPRPTVGAGGSRGQPVARGVGRHGRGARGGASSTSRIHGAAALEGSNSIVGKGMTKKGRKG